MKRGLQQEFQELQEIVVHDMKMTVRRGKSPSSTWKVSKMAGLIAITELNKFTIRYLQINMCIYEQTHSREGNFISNL